jgi:inosine-uridine nucleoside N-ribohydrolase
VRIEPERLDRIGSHGDVGKSIVSLAQFYRDAYLKLEPDLAGFPVHDLVVIAFGLRPEWFTTDQLNVRVDRCGEFTTGMTVADFRSSSKSPKDVTVCMAANNSSEILDWFEATLRRATR